MRVGGGVEAANAGLIASRNGSAIAVPIPCSMARRESRLLGFMPSSIRALSHLERAALDNTENQARKLVISGGRLPADFFHCASVRTFEAAPQRERQHLLRQISRESACLRPQDVLQPPGAWNRLAIRQSSDAIHVEVSIARSPASGRIVVLQTKAERIHLVVAGGAGEIHPMHF